MVEDQVTCLGRFDLLPPPAPLSQASGQPKTRVEMAPAQPSGTWIADLENG